jgi:hypothetical protein
MPYYRIRIDELNNGKTRYVPQEGSLITHRGWLSKRSKIHWQDIHKGFDTEEDALEVINYAREYRDKKEGKQIKKSTYKIID